MEPLYGDCCERKDACKHEHRKQIVDDGAEPVTAEYLPPAGGGVLEQLERHHEGRNEQVRDSKVHDVVVGHRVHV
ncbi:hypothetical protein DPMN_193173 [Dreissena polymorpha]|uniref:Uncharacterized protein n=1 Tax=Dreissena polymorpha TaxID=45954 RepID=A0A9D4BEW7_DREPO|nr:hypothetical protein DPMN_193173 [Dreissena polymorpha]